MAPKKNPNKGQSPGKKKKSKSPPAMGAKKLSLTAVKKSFVMSVEKKGVGK